MNTDSLIERIWEAHHKSAYGYIRTVDIVEMIRQNDAATVSKSSDINTTKNESSMGYSGTDAAVVDAVAQALFKLDWDSENWSEIIISNQEERIKSYREKAHAAIKAMGEVEPASGSSPTRPKGDNLASPATIQTGGVYIYPIEQSIQTMGDASACKDEGCVNTAVSYQTSPATPEYDNPTLQEMHEAMEPRSEIPFCNPGAQQALNDFQSGMQAGQVAKTRQRIAESNAAQQREICDNTDEFCISRDFEEWAILPPKMSIEKDGDGEYEDAQTRWMYKTFEAGYKKGMWGAARKINDDLVTENAKYQQEIMQSMRDSKPVSVDLERVQQEYYKRGWKDAEEHYAEYDGKHQPVGYTGSCSLAALKGGMDGYIFPTSLPAHPIPLYTSPIVREMSYAGAIGSDPRNVRMNVAPAPDYHTHVGIVDAVGGFECASCGKYCKRNDIEG